MRRCPQCNRVYRVYGLDITFCLHDGALLGDTQSSEQTHVLPERAPTQHFQSQPAAAKVKGNTFRAVAIAGLILGIIFGVLLLAQVLINTQKQKPQSSLEVSSSPPVDNQEPSVAITPPSIKPTAVAPPVPAPSDLVAGQMTVEPLSFKSIKFTVAATGHQGVLVGKYEAWGGKNDINVVLLNAGEISGFQNFGSYRYYYNPGYIHSDRIKLRLPPGEYVLIFNNRSAGLTTKVVEAYIELRYE